MIWSVRLCGRKPNMQLFEVYIETATHYKNGAYHIFITCRHNSLIISALQLLQASNCHHQLNESPIKQEKENIFLKSIVIWNIDDKLWIILYINKYLYINNAEKWNGQIANENYDMLIYIK